MSRRRGPISQPKDILTDFCPGVLSRLRQQALQPHTQMRYSAIGLPITFLTGQHRAARCVPCKSQSDLQPGQGSLGLAGKVCKKAEVLVGKIACPVVCEMLDEYRKACRLLTFEVTIQVLWLVPAQMDIVWKLLCGMFLLGDALRIQKGVG
jgi:hypothetical protein